MFQKGKHLFTSPPPPYINIAWDLGSGILAKVAVTRTRGFPRKRKASGRSLTPFFRFSTTMAGKLYMPRGQIYNETQDVPGRVSKDVLAGVVGRRSGLGLQSKKRQKAIARHSIPLLGSDQYLLIRSPYLTPRNTCSSGPCASDVVLETRIPASQGGGGNKSSWQKSQLTLPPPPSLVPLLEKASA